MRCTLILPPGIKSAPLAVRFPDFAIKRDHRARNEMIVAIVGLRREAPEKLQFPISIKPPQTLNRVTIPCLKRIFGVGFAKEKPRLVPSET